MVIYIYLNSILFPKKDWTAGLQAYNKSSPVVSRVSKT